MPRWLFILSIAVITWFALTVYESGVIQRSWHSVAETEMPDWKPAAEHPTSDRTEDAFQRAWNTSEKRVNEALGSDGAAD